LKDVEEAFHGGASRPEHVAVIQRLSFMAKVQGPLGTSREDVARKNRSIADYERAPLPVILAAIAAAAPTREALLRDANQRGERPPRLNVARLTAIAPDACRLH
jgi:hypothetical protein